MNEALPVRQIRGIGPKKAELLGNLGIRTLGDALRHFPRSYVDRSGVRPLASGEQWGKATYRGVVESVRGVPAYGAASRAPMKLLIRDDTARAEVVFFNARFLKGTFQVGETYCFFGDVRRNGRLLSLQHPEFCKAEDFEGFARLTPIYPLAAGLTQNDLRSLIGQILQMGLTDPDPLPERIRLSQGLMAYGEALRCIHQPPGPQEAELARRRFAFDELFWTQMALLTIKKGTVNAEKRHDYREPAVLGPLLEALPFTLTDGQQAVLEAILQDMGSRQLMNRLVQGDVGSGKTVLALAAAYHAAVSGHQTAVMAPTEILARQHHAFFSRLLEPLGIRTRLLTGGMKDRKEALEALASGEAAVAIGTHALIQMGVTFKSLALVITDEQHRFGVRQRSLLAQKAEDHPDILFMSATPIPRTLSLILYGDVEVSYLTEMPKGRLPVKTHYIKESKRQDLYRFLRERLDAGERAFIVCPLVADSEEVEAASAESHYDAIRSGPCKGYGVGLVHGQMKSAEKEAAMERFASGAFQVLVSTTVIEVGVDVPAATVMIIEDCDRFGLAQLHQLRGRVGRGGGQSWCFLMSPSPGAVARERIKTLTETSDGLLIAQKDLELRGPGEIFGTRQHGLPEFKAANLLQDMDLLASAQEEAVRTLKEGLATEGEKLVLERHMAGFSI